MRILFATLCLMMLVGCATTNAADQLTAMGITPIENLDSIPIQTPLQVLSQSLGVLADNPLITAANKDAADTLAWVNGASGPTDALAKFRASQCPMAIQLATANLKQDIAMLQGLVTGLDTKIASGLSGPPEPILALTKLRYAPAGVPGADPKAVIASMKHDIFERVTAVVDSCRAVIPAKQISALALDAMKLGGVPGVGFLP